MIVVMIYKPSLLNVRWLLGSNVSEKACNATARALFMLPYL